MSSSSTLWALYLSGVALILVLPTITAIVKHSKGLPLILGLNALGVVLPIPCWVAAMGFAVLGAKSRRTRPVAAIEPDRFPHRVQTAHSPEREKALL